jgi:NADH-quinone oxidoreductase subunit I
MKVKRVKPTLFSRLYLPSIIAGLKVTFRHIFLKKDTLQYPEQQRVFGERYRGVPALVKDQDGRTKCVACYMCQWVCPPLAITIEAQEIPEQDKARVQIEKEPSVFEINMLRCIYCGLCEEACPEEAIFMSKTYAVTGLSRKVMIFDKEKLLDIGGTRPDDTRKWAPEHKGPDSRSHVPADRIASGGASSAH